MAVHPPPHPLFCLASGAERIPSLRENAALLTLIHLCQVPFISCVLYPFESRKSCTQAPLCLPASPSLPTPLTRLLSSSSSAVGVHACVNGCARVLDHYETLG